MHLADYDGSLAQERARRIRRDNIKAIWFALVIVAVFVGGAALAILTLSAFGK